MADDLQLQASGFYFADQLAALLERKRRVLPDHTEADPADPLNRLLSLFAFVGHGAAVRIDHAARQVYPRTATERSSLIALAALVGYDVATAVPAEVVMLADLSGPVSSGTTLVRARTRWATSSQGTAVEFETAAAIVTTQDTGTFTVIEADGADFEEQAEPVAGIWSPYNAGDSVLIGHPDAMFSGISLDLPTPATGDSTIRWEYSSPGATTEPDAVVVVGGTTLRLTVSALVGSSRADGLAVTVRCLRTGQTEALAVAWVGGANTVTTSDLLGQVSASTRAADYEVSADWRALPNVDDGTDHLRAAGEVVWTLPKSAAHDWTPATITLTLGAAAGEERTAYWIRARVVLAASGAAPAGFGSVDEAAGATWTIEADASQGRTVDDRLGATDGTASQAFTLTSSPFLSLTSVVVGSVTYDRVADLLGSASYDKHFTLRERTDGTWRLTFGDGTRGRVPPAAEQVVATYKIGGDVSGDVGIGQITIDRTGNSRLRNVRNVRAASGWAEAEGMSEAGRALLAERIGRAARVSEERVVTPEDAEAFAVAFRTADGSQVAARAVAVEGGGGPQTLTLVCVGPGGAAPTAADVAELEEALNGVEVGIQRVGGVMVANQRAEPTAYTPYPVDVTITAYVLTGYTTGAEDRGVAAISAALSPLARVLERDDATGAITEGTDYQWRVAGEVAPDIIGARLVPVLPGLSRMTISAPAAPITLGDTDLPVPGTISLTIVAV